MSKAIPVALSGSDAQGYTGAGSLVGFTCRSTGVQTVQLRDGTSAAGPLLAVAEFAAAGTVVASLPSVDFTTGVFVDRTGAGTTELVLYLGGF